MENFNFGERLKQLLMENDMTQQKLSEKLYISPSTLNGYIKNNRMPEYEMLLKISRLFNTSCDYLLGNNKLKQSENDYLNEDESRVIELYRKMNDTGKKLLMEESVLFYKNFSEK